MAGWLTELTPNEYVSSVYDIDLDKLRDMGKRVILTDLDNTLVPWNHKDAPASLQSWIRLAQERGFRLCIISNNRGARVAAFAKRVGIPAVGAARKPKPRAFLQALEELGAKPEEAVMVGDQLFTDVRGGNRCGLYTILVLPIDPVEWWGTRLVRQAERVALWALRRRGMQEPPRSS
ncbi:YqeG family HAD IIIA-type phosphatase [Alicyclobacillus cycloheptanicus]|uniref:HAD superfamily phosphatase (TIGR01668 family) n=1 Tax=Alicyclobacillus cycloheptanicus TaxID=1457 RepID=A0ABT9XJM3_9BACL|nr:YqeG family HAD IIIA-type phosphatase [Alicyclobacillus cycloheptanicus]MDQ0190507.1 HAD superfamily phosphatase (TIGR01668 family) [Alicyclobacillus cycloheptanicus]WDM00731.1 YqeG family HAD IIIA-type phosphatase [Alicyclobacillus cycloheptanicus]